MKQKQLTQRHLLRNQDKLKRFTRVRIYSKEWRAWWRNNGVGYTDDIRQAGIYDIDDAWKRVRHCGPEKKIIIESCD